MNALLYTRVSKEDQVKYGMSLQTQLDDLTRYCSENHLNVRKVYSDEGISGGSIKKMYEMLTKENKRSFWHRFVKEIYHDRIVYY